MQITIEERPPLTLGYLRRVGAYGPGIADFYAAAVLPWLKAHGWLERARYGVIHDDPSLVPASQCRYDVGVATAAGEAARAGVSIETLAGGRCAVAAFRGTPADVGEAWHALLTLWLPESGLRPGPRPFLECYPGPGEYDPATGVFRCTLVVPIGSG